MKITRTEFMDISKENSPKETNKRGTNKHISYGRGIGKSDDSRKL